MTINLWQNIPSILQSSLVRHLAKKVNVRLLIANDIPPMRKELGWHYPDFGNADVIMYPTKKNIKHLLNEKETVNIISGILAHPLLGKVLKEAVSNKNIVGIFSEAKNRIGIKGIMRTGFEVVNSFRFKRSISFILATGQLGIKWFKEIGYLENKIFEFGYFVECPQEKIVVKKNNVFKIIFVGQFVYRKGIDILLRALAYNKKYNWELNMIGTGPYMGKIIRLIKTLGLTERVSILGVKTNKQTVSILNNSDLLILPSRWDGWGAVINEALMLGIPVIASDLCGASTLISENRGHIFKSGSVKDLSLKMREFLTKEKTTLEERILIKNWAKKISGESGANYLMEIIEHSKNSLNNKPIPPWLK